MPPSSTRSRLASAVIAVMLTAAGCATGSAAGHADTVPSTGTVPPSTYRAVACADPVPVDPRVSCGDLVVPDTRDRADGRTVHVPVAVVHSAAAHPAPDPILMLPGGPGGSGLASARAVLAGDFGGDRDVILIDERGSGRSQPTLACPEADAVAWTRYGPGTPADRARVRLDAITRCHDRLIASGVDLDAYTTSAIADDLEDLRHALGVTQWNLYGVSYGAITAFELVRHHGEAVRSVVLNAPYSGDVPLDGAPKADGAARAFDALFAQCQADPSCNTAHPDLAGELQQAVTRLNDTPYTTTVHDSGGSPHTITVNGDDLVELLFLAMYDTTLIPGLPAAIGQFATGHYPLLDATLPQAIPDEATAPTGFTDSILCSDQAASTLTTTDLDAVYRAHPDDHTLVGPPTIADTCNAWKVAPAPAQGPQPPTLNQPALVLSGELDPVVQPDHARQLAARWPDGQYVEIPGAGHAPTITTQPCLHHTVQAFLDRPDQPVDTCATQLPEPTWTPG
jgi:pimeloyl-ACP methyl ester carboxylesterase